MTRLASIPTAIANHRAAYDAFQVAPDDEAESACCEMADALDALVLTACSFPILMQPLPADAGDLLAHLRWWLAEEAEHADAYQPNYGILLGRAADLWAALPPVPAALSGADPVLPAIATADAAAAAHTASLVDLNEDDDTQMRAVNAAADAASMAFEAGRDERRAARREDPQGDRGGASEPTLVGGGARRSAGRGADPVEGTARIHAVPRGSPRGRALDAVCRLSGRHDRLQDGEGGCRGVRAVSGAAGRDPRTSLAESDAPVRDVGGYALDRRRMERILAQAARSAGRGGAGAPRAAEISKGTVCVTPILSASANDQERVIEVKPDGGSANFAMFDTLPSEPEAQGVAAPGAEPPGMRFAACSKVYAAFPGQVRRAPFAGSLVALCARGSARGRRAAERGAHARGDARNP